MTSNDKIKQIRKERGLTQKQLAEMVGYTDRSMIAKIEAGKVDLQESKLKALFKRPLVQIQSLGPKRNPQVLDTQGFAGFFFFLPKSRKGIKRNAIASSVAPCFWA